MFEHAETLRKILKKENNKTITQLAELLEMQQALDTAILKDKGIKAYPEDNIEIALFVELGELLNEFPTTFKYWKKTAKDDRKKGLIEYVDCLHFALSLTNDKAEILTNEIVKGSITVSDFDYNLDTDVYEFDLHYLLQEVTTTKEELKICYLFEIGRILGFTWSEIYKAYIDKNKVNYERLRGGY